MRSLLLAALCAGALAASGAASAEPAHAGADLIESARAGGVFQVIDEGAAFRLRHSASGMVCSFDSADDNALRLFETMSRGDDVACISAQDHAARTLFATRSGRRGSLDAHMDSAETMIRHIAPDAIAYEPAGPHPVSASSAGAAVPQHRTARFVYRDGDGVQLYTRVSIAMFEGWVFKLRYTALAGDDGALAAADEQADALWSRTLADIAAARSV